MLLLGVDEGVNMPVVPQLEGVVGLPHIVLGALLAGHIGPVYQTQGLTLTLKWTG